MHKNFLIKIPSLKIKIKNNKNLKKELCQVNKTLKLILYLILNKKVY